MPVTSLGAVFPYITVETYCFNYTLRGAPASAYNHVKPCSTTEIRTVKSRKVRNNCLIFYLGRRADTFSSTLTRFSRCLMNYHPRAGQLSDDATCRAWVPTVISDPTVITICADRRQRSGDTSSRGVFTTRWRQPRQDATDVHKQPRSTMRSAFC